TTSKASCNLLVIRHLIEVETFVASANHVEPSLLGRRHPNRLHVSGGQALRPRRRTDHSQYPAVKYVRRRKRYPDRLFDGCSPPERSGVQPIPAALPRGHDRPAEGQ